MRFELTTSSLATKCSTTELRPQPVVSRDLDAVALGCKWKRGLAKQLI
jgi:hypothetical protein